MAEEWLCQRSGGKINSPLSCAAAAQAAARRKIPRTGFIVLENSSLAYRERLSRQPDQVRAVRNRAAISAPVARPQVSFTCSVNHSPVAGTLALIPADSRR